MFETVPKIVEKAQNGQSGTSTLSRVAQKWLKTLMAERGIETTQKWSKMPNMAIKRTINDKNGFINGRKGPEMTSNVSQNCRNGL